MNTKKGTVIHHLVKGTTGSITVTSPYLNNGEKIIVDDKDVKKCLPILIINAGKVKAIQDDPFQEV